MAINESCVTSPEFPFRITLHTFISKKYFQDNLQPLQKVKTFLKGDKSPPLYLSHQILDMLIFVKMTLQNIVRQLSLTFEGANFANWHYQLQLRLVTLLRAQWVDIFSQEIACSKVYTKPKAYNFFSEPEHTFVHKGSLLFDRVTEIVNFNPSQNRSENPTTELYFNLEKI